LEQLVRVVQERDEKILEKKSARQAEKALARVAGEPFFFNAARGDAIPSNVHREYW
jgi:hypothetical protein